MTVPDAIVFAVFLVPLLMALYLAFLTIAATRVRPTTEFAAERRRSFAVVVPAHNESGTIERTLDSLSSLEYPGPSYTVIVIADNCSDDTAEIARRHGAHVMERFDGERRGKGYALRWCFDQLTRDHGRYDAVVVIDADSVVRPGFLTVMNFYLERGFRSIQASDLVAPQPDSWSAEMTRVGFLLYNYVRPLGRTALGGSAGLRGNGMCFSLSLLREVPWEAFSIAEDLEFGIQLLLKGTMTGFAPEAEVLATMPREAENARSQRARWEGGRMRHLREYGLRLAIAFARSPRFMLVDQLLDLVTPPLVNLAAFAVMGVAVSGVLMIAGFLSVSGLIVPCATLALLLFHFALGLRIAGTGADAWRLLVIIPRYALWKLTVYAGMKDRFNTRQWIRTSRESRSENVRSSRPGE